MKLGGEYAALFSEQESIDLFRDDSNSEEGSCAKKPK